MGLFDFLRLGGPIDSSGRLDVEPVDDRDRTASDRELAGVVQTTPRWQRGYDVLEALLPDVDDALAEEGADVYRRMEADPEISACLFQIDSRVLGRDLEWSPPPGMEGDPFAVEVADYVGLVTRSELDLRADLRNLFRSKTRRFAVGQLVWRPGDGRYGEPVGTWVPDRLIAEERKNFRVHRTGTLLARRAGSWRPLTPPLGDMDRKFVLARYDPEPDRPEGKSLLDGIYWSWKLLRAGGGLWLDLLDRFGVPSIIALLDAIGDPGDPEALSRAQALADDVTARLAAIESGSSAALAAKSATTVDTGGSGKDFELFCTFLEKRMRKGILSTTLTVDLSDVGARAQGEVSEREVDRVAQWHGAELARTVERSLGRWTALARFGDRARTAFPRASFDWRTTASFEHYLRAAEAGVPVSREAFYTVYNLPRPNDDGDAFTAERVTATTASQEPEVSFSDAPFGRSPTGRPRRRTTPTS